MASYHDILKPLMLLAFVGQIKTVYYQKSEKIKFRKQ
jgi:hypothetical protein